MGFCVLSNEMIKQLVDLHVAPLLNESEFRRKNLAWNRSLASIVHFIDVQPSRWNDAGSQSFTLNVGLWSEAEWKIYSDKPGPRFIKEHDCFPVFRVGNLLGGFSHNSNDVWWTISNPSDIAHIGTEIHNVIRQHCIPFFDQFNSRSDVKTFLDNNPFPYLYPASQIYLAILSHLGGDAQGCQELLEGVKQRGTDMWCRKIEEVRHRLSKIEAKDL